MMNMNRSRLKEVKIGKIRCSGGVYLSKIEITANDGSSDYLMKLNIAAHYCYIEADLPWVSIVYYSKAPDDTWLLVNHEYSQVQRQLVDIRVAITRLINENVISTRNIVRSYEPYKNVGSSNVRASKRR